MFEKKKKAWKAIYEKKIEEILADPDQIVAAIASRASVKIKGGPMILESTNKNHELLSADQLPELYQNLDAPHDDSHFEFSGTDKDRIQDTVAKHIKTQNLDIPTSKKFLYDAVHWLAYTHVLTTEGLLQTQIEAISNNPENSEEIAADFEQFHSALKTILAKKLSNELKSQQQKAQTSELAPAAQSSFFARVINAVKNALSGLANAIKNLFNIGQPANRATENRAPPLAETHSTNHMIQSLGGAITNTKQKNKAAPIITSSPEVIKAQWKSPSKHQEDKLKTPIEASPQATPEESEEPKNTHKFGK